ncbi:hypothetical protein [Streptomyces sp. NPDC048438]|uniref:hypothetical protein n=1 Tax=Streptomyces sp. NPDC048438 TaxID=3365551 RepID=UPI00372351B0
MSSIAESVAIATGAATLVPALAELLRRGRRRSRQSSEPLSGESVSEKSAGAILYGVVTAGEPRVNLVDVTDDPEMLLLWELADKFADLNGRPPTATELRAVFKSEYGPPGRGFDVTVEVVASARRGADRVSMGAEPTPDRSMRVARRKLGLALCFLPAKEREHYRIEWSAEMGAMSPAVAAQFAANVLLRAPVSGVTLRFARIFGRQAA